MLGFVVMSVANVNNARLQGKHAFFSVVDVNADLFKVSKIFRKYLPAIACRLSGHFDGPSCWPLMLAVLKVETFAKRACVYFKPVLLAHSLSFLC